MGIEIWFVFSFCLELRFIVILGGVVVILDFFVICGLVFFYGIDMIFVGFFLIDLWVVIEVERLMRGSCWF